MDAIIIGKFIKECREKKKLTQNELANILFVSNKTISKWETGNGFPDISMIEPLGKILEVSTAELLSGQRIENKNQHANMLQTKFYICPVCQNVIASIGECGVSCHGISLNAIQPNETNEVTVEAVEDDYYLQISSPMTKSDYITFVAGVSFDRVELIKLYPESPAECRLKRRGLRFIYFYDIKKGLFKQSNKR